MGAVVPEALAAAERLEAAGVPADVVCVTSPGLLFRALRARAGRRARPAARRAVDPRAGVPGRPRHAAGHRPGRAPAHAGVPGHRQPGAARRAGRGAVRPVRVDRGPVPLQRHRHRQHHPRRPGPDPVTPHGRLALAARETAGLINRVPNVIRSSIRPRWHYRGRRAQGRSRRHIMHQIAPKPLSTKIF